MGFRSVYITSKADLSIKNSQLVIAQEETVLVPMEDIAAIVLEDRRTAMTALLLSELSEAGVAVYFCDEKHMPNSVSVPYCQHSRQAAILKLQLDASVPLKKRLWQRIVQQKLVNQGLCLQLLGLEGEAYLRSCAKAVQSGDATNREAVGAKYYFAKWLPNVHRRDEHPVNGALDYGYAILRGAIARSLAAHGFHIALGLHHDSELNAMNLADDFLEPFRPMVDVLVGTNPPAGEELTRQDRAALVAVLHQECQMPNGVTSVLSAIEQMTGSLAAVYRNKDAALLNLPSVLNPKGYQREE